MRAVNLLPERHRPRRPTGGHRGSAYVVLGALGAVLVGVLLYVLTLNSINTDRNQVTEAKAETTRLQAQAQQLGPYGNFDKVKTQRVQAVRQLAQDRFDWERMVRELAHVTPSGVWIMSASASDSPADAQAGAAAANAGALSGGPNGNPSLQISGCSPTQTQVAVTLVRLRQLQGALDVQLSDSGTGSSAGGSAGQCGAVHGHAAYQFDVNVTFAAKQIQNKPGTVPASLGGGQ